MSPLRFVEIGDLLSCVAVTGEKLRGQVVAYMKLLVNHVYRVVALSFSWEIDVKKWTMAKVIVMFPNISHKF